MVVLFKCLVWFRITLHPNNSILFVLLFSTAVSKARGYPIEREPYLADLKERKARK